MGSRTLDEFRKLRRVIRIQNNQKNYAGKELPHNYPKEERKIAHRVNKISNHTSPGSCGDLLITGK